MSLVQRAILYLFPLYLTGMEQIIRTIFSAEAFSASTLSSSISVGGLAMLLPFLAPSPFTEGLNQQVLDELRKTKMKTYKSKDQNSVPPNALPSLHAFQRSVNDAVSDDLRELAAHIESVNLRIPNDRVARHCSDGLQADFCPHLCALLADSV